MQTGRCFVAVEQHGNAAVVTAAPADNGAYLFGEAWATNCSELTHFNTRTD
jgi:hypothetical protein